MCDEMDKRGNIRGHLFKKNMVKIMRSGGLAQKSYCGIFSVNVIYFFSIVKYIDRISFF